MRDEKNNDNTMRNVALVFIGAFISYIVLGLILWGGLHMYIQPDSIQDDSSKTATDSSEATTDSSKAATAKKDIIQAVGFILAGLAGTFAGVAAGVGIFFTWQNLKHAQKSSRDTLRLTERGQVTERFTRAIDQLGSTRDKDGKEQLEVRLGGIYALEQIARDYKEDYYGQIMGVLNAYVREHSLWKNSDREEDQLPQDIQAILTVLGRLLHYQVEEEEGEPVNLSDTDLRGGNLVEVPLKSANLRRAHLEKASLHEAHLEEADLHLAHLERAELISANLKAATLSRANLTQAAALSVNLERANLNIAILDGASLQGAGFSRANLDHASLDGALLQGIRWPNQYGLPEKTTDLREARWLLEEQIIRANGDDTTLLPEGLPKPTWWSKVPSVSTDPLSPGEYSINVLKVALSFVVDEEGWRCRVARWPDILQLVSRFGNLTFANIKAVYDLSEPSSTSTLPMPDDLIPWLQVRARPYLRTEEPFPVTIGDVSGTAIDILVSTLPLPPVPLGFHLPGVLFCRFNFDDKMIGSSYAFISGIKTRLMFLKVRGEAVTVIFDSPEDRFDEAFLKAKKSWTS